MTRSTSEGRAERDRFAPISAIDSKTIRACQALLSAGAAAMNAALRAYADTAYAVAVLAYFNPPAATRPADWLHARLPLK